MPRLKLVRPFISYVEFEQFEPDFFFIRTVMYSGLAFGDNPIKHAERGRGQLAYWVRDLKLGGGCLYPYSFH